MSASISLPAAASPASRSAILAESLRLFALPLVTAVLLCGAFPPLDWDGLAWVALVPCGFALVDRRNWAEMYFGAFLGGLLFQLAHVDWIRTAHGGAGLSGSRATQWLAQGLGLALLWPVALLAGRRLVRRTGWPLAIALPIVWVAFDFARKNYWVLVDATGYPWAQLGLTQANHPHLVQIADLGGVYAVTAVVAAVNGLLVDLARYVAARRRGETRSAPIAAAVGVALVLLATWTYGVWRLSQPTPREGPVACLMPNQTLRALEPPLAPSEPASDGAETPAPEPPAFDDGGLAEAIAAGGSRDESGQPLRPDVLIWSEAVYRYHVAEPTSAAAPSRDAASEPSLDQQVNAHLANFARHAAATLVLGCTRDNRTGVGGSTFNSAAVFDPDGRHAGCYDKVFLVPFSEFQPAGRPTFGRALADPYARGENYPQFPVTTAADGRTFTTAAAICYDICFPQLFRRYMNPTDGESPPDFFSVPACEAHDNTFCLQRALLRLAQFRAIECRRPFVRNADGGYSGIIDGNGVLIAAPVQINFDSPAILGRMPLDTRTSLYAQCGDWLPIAALLALAAGIARPARRNIPGGE